MKVWPVIFGIAMVCLPSVVEAQVAGEILIQGKVINMKDGKAIKCDIRYKSLPTGGITGHFLDSTFSFSIFGSSKYELIAEREGYIPAVAIVDPKTAGTTGKIVRDLHLTLKGETIRLTHLIFELGKSVIDPRSFDELDELALLMTDHQKLIIQLEGHTDKVGNSGKNLELSQDRVDEVKKYLVSKNVSKNRVKTKAFGGTQPLSKGNSPEDANLNRRVEIRILSE